MDLLEALQEVRRQGYRVTYPVTHDDLGRVFRVLKQAGIHHNLESEPIWRHWHECQLSQALGKHKAHCEWCCPEKEVLMLLKLGLGVRI